MTEPILAVRDLSVDARTPEGLRPVLEDVSFTLHPGETLCLAGESGLGKSLTALSIIRLLSLSLKPRSGSIGAVIAEEKVSIFPFVEEKGLLFVQIKKRKIILSAGPYIGLIPLSPNVIVDVRPKLPVYNLARVLDTAKGKLTSISGITMRYGVIIA